MRGLERSIEIQAGPEAVWGVLTDLDGYEVWNPFITKASGTVMLGESIEVTIGGDGSRKTTFRPTVTAADEMKRFEWLGRVGFKGVFDGRHRFELETRNGGTMLTQSEEFTGVLAPLLLPFLRKSTEAGFEAMNAAIKVEAEGMSPNGP